MRLLSRQDDSDERVPRTAIAPFRAPSVSFMPSVSRGIVVVVIFFGRAGAAVGAKLVRLSSSRTSLAAFDFFLLHVR